jgi:hypothetical protein
MDVYPEPYLNAFLVDKGVREAYLFQTIDYDEHSPSDPKSAERLAMIQKEFPSLVFTPMRQGVLVAKRLIAKKEYSRDAPLAKLLGFPCVLAENPEYSYSIHARVNGQTVPLIDYVCPTRDTEHLLFQKIKTALQEKGIEDVNIDETKTIFPGEISSKLQLGTPLSKDEMDSLTNYIENLGFSRDFDATFLAIFQQQNPVHRGIAITLLSLYENNPMQPFYPLQYHEEMNAVISQTMKFEMSIRKTLEQTTRSGGSRKKKTYRRKH